MNQGIGEWVVDNIVIPVALGVIGVVYFIRHLFRKVGL